MSTISDSIASLNARIAAAAEKTGRIAADVTLIAATKQRTPSEIDEAIRAGIAVVGENRVQEAQEKKPCVTLPASWHLIGHLQTNKVKRTLEIFDLIQSVDSLKLAAEIDHRAQAAGRRVEVMIEVNTSGEASKSGVAPEQCGELAALVSELSSLSVVGLMTIGLFAEDPDLGRPCFARLRDVRDEVARAGMSFAHLSMGMSHDFEAAIEEGSTMVRIGTGIFGSRPRA